MTDINVTFSRNLLCDIHKEVKQAFPNVNLKTDAWVYHYDRDNWEFHADLHLKDESKFYWHGKAHNAFEARAHGWEAVLRKYGGRGPV
jgi:hypothetical protein